MKIPYLNEINYKQKIFPDVTSGKIFCYVLEPAGAKLQHNCICECSRWLKHTTSTLITLYIIKNIIQNPTDCSVGFCYAIVLIQ
jgi:hypothetical protein